jgi:hypothetical protein
MSVNISVSSTKQTSCEEIIKKLFNSRINSRMIKTTSVVDDNIEIGCLITFGKEYGEKNKIKKIWDIIKSDYTCSHLKIDGQFDGCIYNYLKANFCPGDKV